MVTLDQHASPIHLLNHSLANIDEQLGEHVLLHALIYAAVWIILVTTMICGSIGNILVLSVYVNRNDNKTCTFFIKALAIVDLLICLVLAPLELYQTTTGERNDDVNRELG